MSDFAGLMAFWMLGTNTGFPPDTTWGGSGWQNNVLPCLNDGLSTWVGYRYSGKGEWFQYGSYVVRLWGSRSCGGPTQIPCEKGYNVRNVMMYDESTLAGDQVFPFLTVPPGLTVSDGPRGSDRAALFFGAVFYDIANEAGLGIHKADLLIWKTISVISNNVTFTMRDFGAKVIEAAQALWPDGRYTNDIADVLTSRGIPVFGVPDFRTNLPPAIGDASTLETNASTRFGSLHPETHPGPQYYGNYSASRNGYTHPDSNAQYVAYQFYKHSKYGPCDKLALTDGTFTGTTTPPFAWTYNNDGTFYIELTDRDLGNLTLMIPGRQVRWVRSRQRCPDEVTGYYVEDVRPFGFRVIKATPNGFSFTAQRLGETTNTIQYRLSIVDPSLATLGAADYAWAFTNHLGSATFDAGLEVQYTATKDEPFTVSITRIRGPTTDTLTLRERGNDLDRNGGQAFVRNSVP